MYGERIRVLRKEMNLTQEELSRHIGVSRAVLAKYESEHAEPNIATLTNLSNFFSTSVDYIIGNTNIKNGQIIDDMSKIADLYTLFDNTDVEGTNILGHFIVNFGISLDISEKKKVEDQVLLIEALLLLVIYFNDLSNMLSSKNTSAASIINYFTSTQSKMCEYIGRIADNMISNDI